MSASDAKEVKSVKSVKAVTSTQDAFSFPSEELEHGIRCLRLSRNRDANKILQKVADKKEDAPNNFIARLFLGINYIYGYGVPRDKAVGKEHLRVFKEYMTEQGYLTAIVKDHTTTYTATSKAETNSFLLYCLGHLYADETFKSPKTAVEYFTLAAEQGNADALVRLGQCYADGYGGVEKDAAKAMQFYTKAASKGVIHGKKFLALILRKNKKYAEARSLLEEAVRGGDIRAQTILAHSMLSPPPFALAATPRDALRATRMLLEARIQEHGYASYLLAIYCKKDSFRAFDPDEIAGMSKEFNLPLLDDSVKHVFALYKEAAERNYPLAYVALGRLRIDNSWSIFPKDAELAFVYFLKAVEKGKVEAYMDLYQCYSEGEGGVKKNASLATEYLIAAAKAGVGNARYVFKERFGEEFSSETHTEGWLGEEIYQQSRDADFDHANVIETLERAIALGSIAANLELGRCYLERARRGDELLAVACFEKIADQEPQAIVELGTYYLDKDSLKAIAWFREGAKKGHTPAQVQLGACYETGKGVQANLKEAIYWYSMAASKGYLKAIESFRQLLGFDLGFDDYDRYRQIVGRHKEGAAETDSVADTKESLPSYRPTDSPAAFSSCSEGVPPLTLPTRVQTVRDVKRSTSGVSTALDELTEQEEAEILFEQGIFHSKDSQGTEKAISFLIEATLQGHWGAQEALIKIIKPEDLRKWHEAALKNRFKYIVNYYRAGAKENPVLQYWWARCYELGLYGMPKTPDRAKVWYERSAGKKHSHADAARKALQRLAPKKELPKPEKQRTKPESLTAQQVSAPKDMFWSQATYPEGREQDNPWEEMREVGVKALTTEELTVNQDAKNSQPHADSTVFPSEDLLKAIRCLKLTRLHEGNQILQGLVKQEKSSPNNIFAGLFLGVNHLRGFGFPAHKAAAAAYLDQFKAYMAPLLHNRETENDKFLVYCLGYLKFHDDSFPTPKTAAQYFQLAIDLGDANSCTLLSSCYQRGVGGVEKDIEKSIAWSQVARSKKALLGNHALAFSFGRQANELATGLFLEAEKQGDIQAKTELAQKNIETRDFVQAAKRLCEARDQGYGWAIYLLACYYDQGLFKSIDPKLRAGMEPWLFEENLGKVFELYSEAANCGEPLANIGLGHLCRAENSEHLPRWAESSSAYYLKAADQGSVEGYYYLALCYEEGRGGVERNEALYVEYLVKAARGGYQQALDKFKNFIGVPFNPEIHTDLWLGKFLYDQAKEYLENGIYNPMVITALQRAVALGQSSANYELGMCYLSQAKKKGCASPEAVDCFTQVKEEHPKAIIRLGEYYLDKDPVLAVEWFQQGADRGLPAAQWYMAHCYKKGKGVEVNLKEAIYWYSMAASQGDTQAMASFKKLLGFDYTSYEQIMGKPEKRAAKAGLSSSDSKMSQPLRAEAPADLSLAPAVGGSASSESTLSAGDAKGFSFDHPGSEPKNAGKLYERGLKCRDKVEALGFFIQATLEGHSEAHKALLAVEAEVVEKWHKAALGDPEAQFMVGECYRSGKSGLGQDINLAIHWYSKAVEQGNVLAKQALKAFSSEQILECYEASAKDKDDHLAKYRLARCYDFGLYGIKQNPARAEYWYRQAAKEEHRYAEAAREGAKSFLPLAPLLWFSNAEFVPQKSKGLARPMLVPNKEVDKEDMLDERAMPAPVVLWKKMTMFPAKKGKQEAKTQDAEKEGVDLSGSRQEEPDELAVARR